MMPKQIASDVRRDWKRQIDLPNHQSHPPRKDAMLQTRRDDGGTFSNPKVANPRKKIVFQFPRILVTTTHDVEAYEKA